MKALNNYVHFPILLVGFLIFFSGCKKDNTLDREKFIGTYNVAENCTSGTDSYTITITASSSEDDKIIISNLYDGGALLSGTVNSSSLAISTQTIDGITYNGGGTYDSNDLLSINFILTVGADSENCTALCTKL